MTQDEFEALKNAAAQPTPEQVEDYNQTLRQWRAKCRKCGVPIVGTLREIREHRCGNNPIP